MSLVVVVLLSPSLCRLHHTFCIPAPCSPSSNLHILSLLGIITAICISPYPMHSPAQLLYCHYKHTPPPPLVRSIFPPPPSRTQRYAAFIISYTAGYAQLECHSLLYAVCGSGRALCIPPIPVFSFCTPRLPTDSSFTVSHTWVSVHNLELPINFIHCPIQHAHTCAQP